MHRLLPALAVVAASAAELLADGEFYDHFSRPDGLPENWFTSQGFAEIRSHELFLEGPGAEIWTWIDAVNFSGDVTIQFDIAFDPADTDPAVGRHGGLLFFGSEKTTRYSPSMNGYTIDWIDRAGDRGYRLLKWTAGLEIGLLPIGMEPGAEPGGTWRITVEGPTITLEVDGQPRFTFDDAEYREGAIGFWGYANGQHVHIDNVAVGSPPVARIAADPARGPAPLEVTFDGGGSTTPSGSITSYEWSFGGGETAAGPSVRHTFTALGTHQARLTVIDSRGAPASARAEVTALFPAGDVSPWKSADIGAPVFAGGARLEGSCLEAAGGGKEIGGLADAFHFVYQEKTDVTALALRVEEATDWRPGARAGVMFRDGIDPDAAFALMAAHPTAAGVQAVFVSRPVKGGRAVARTHPIVIVPPAAWLRLERQGSELVGFASQDGAAWTEVRRVAFDPPLPGTLLAGMAVTGGDRLEAGNFALITFCELAFGGEPAGTAFHRGDVNADRVLNLTDPISLLGFLFQSGAAPTCLEAANANDDPQLNLTDAIVLLDYLFRAGPAPAPPGPASEPCGRDPVGSTSDLGCAAYAGCG